MHRLSFLVPLALALSLNACGRPEPPPTNSEIARLTKALDQERVARLQAEADKQQAQEQSRGQLRTAIVWGLVGCGASLFAGMAMGSAAARRSRA